MQEDNNKATNSARLLLIGLVAVIVVLALALVVLVVVRSAAPAEETERIDALADSNYECVVCHRRTRPGIVERYAHSNMTAAEISCQVCRELEDDCLGAVVICKDGPGWPDDAAESV